MITLTPEQTEMLHQIQGCAETGEGCYHDAVTDGLIRALADALAAKEAELAQVRGARLRVAAREMLALQDGPQDAAYRELLPIVLRNLRAALAQAQAEGSGG